MKAWLVAVVLRSPDTKNQLKKRIRESEVREPIDYVKLMCLFGVYPLYIPFPGPSG